MFKLFNYLWNYFKLNKNQSPVIFKMSFFFNKKCFTRQVFPEKWHLLINFYNLSWSLHQEIKSYQNFFTDSLRVQYKVIQISCHKNNKNFT